MSVRRWSQRIAVLPGGAGEAAIAEVMTTATIKANDTMPFIDPPGIFIGDPRSQPRRVMDQLIVMRIVLDQQQNLTHVIGEDIDGRPERHPQ